MCDKRNDDWGKEVKMRAMDCNDFVAAEVRYHYSCNEMFGSSRKSVPNSYKGRTVVTESSAAFNTLCEWMESETELYSVSELREKMVVICGEERTYTSKWLKNRIKDRYKEHVHFAEINGKPNVVCFKDVANYLLNDKWYNSRKESMEDEAERIVLTAAKIIQDNIRSKTYQIENYPEECRKRNGVVAKIPLYILASYYKKSNKSC
jgi:hypothetical protein